MSRGHAQPRGRHQRGRSRAPAPEHLRRPGHHVDARPPAHARRLRPSGRRGREPTDGPRRGRVGHTRHRVAEVRARCRPSRSRCGRRGRRSCVSLRARSAGCRSTGAQAPAGSGDAGAGRSRQALEQADASGAQGASSIPALEDRAPASQTGSHASPSHGAASSRRACESDASAAPAACDAEGTAATRTTGAGSCQLPARVHVTPEVLDGS